MTLPKNQCADSANDDCHAQQCESWPSATLGVFLSEPGI